MATIHETLVRSAATGGEFTKQASALLEAAGLTMPADSADRALLLTRIAAERPETTWLEVGEQVGEVEKQPAVGRWTTTVTCYYDRRRLVVIEHHVRGAEGDYDHRAWANAKRYPTAAKADIAWARLAKKYRFAAGVSVAAPAAKPKVSLSVTGDAALRAAWWSNPDDPAALAVLADLWAQSGDPRGEFVQLSLIEEPTPDQTARRDALIKKHGGALVGPARPFLREWEFDRWGMVNVARCEADRLVEGIDEVVKVHPRLCLCVTSLKKQASIAAFAKISLAPLYFVGFSMGLIGSMGGSNLSDKALVGVAPAFRGVKRFALQARGWAPECFSPSGLAAFADHLEDGVEFALLDLYTSDEPGKQALAPREEYVAVLRGHRALRSATIETDYRQLRSRLGLRPAS